MVDAHALETFWLKRRIPALSVNTDVGSPHRSDHALPAATAEVMARLRRDLLSQRSPAGHWRGELSASALGTATAVSAISAMLIAAAVDRDQAEPLIRRGIDYLAGQQNGDGGYGDTDRSHSNIATSYLVLAARTLAAQALLASESTVTEGDSESLARLNGYIADQDGLAGLRRRYGKDKTFVVPIMTNLAIAGLIDWREVARLPFEAAVFPGAMYRFLQMPVVSYAIPALVAIGQVHHFCGPRTWWPIHRIRAAAVAPTMRVLQRMQPDSGGYLEATPLTAFVVMSLAASGRATHPVATRGWQFLKDSIRPDGSWPIDTDLATWVTSLAIHALGQDPRDDGDWATRPLIDWHLGCQHKRRHPFTGANPGGWGWTDLSGAVPDGDDTPAAILAIEDYLTAIVAAERDETSGAATDTASIIDTARAAAVAGLNWLVGLQNRDGGLPTFCRGWGKLPFDRSSTDLTAHLIRAIDAAGRPGLALPQEPALAAARRRGVEFLRRQQRPEGEWVPLWFGNQDDVDEENAIYGTGRVLLAIAGECSLRSAVGRAVDFLLRQQNPDGGWGGGPSRRAWLSSRGRSDSYSSIEETAVAVEGLAAVLRSASWGSAEVDIDLVDEADELVDGDTVSSPAPSAETTRGRETTASPRERQCREAIIAGVRFLVKASEAGEQDEPWPIGFYFAKLWYHERLYPLVLTLAALGAACHCFPPLPPANPRPPDAAG